MGAGNPGRDTLVLKMRAARIISAIVFAAVTVAGCFRDPLFYRSESGNLNVRVYIPEAAITRAETGLEAALEAERRVTSLQIWVFREGATTTAGLVGYRLLDSDALAATGLSTGHETRFTIPVDKDFVDEKPNVDVYAVVNAASAGFTIDKFSYAAGDWSKVTPADLRDFVLEGDIFGVSSLTSEVPAEGLPMAGLATSQTVTGDFPVLSVSTLTLTRAVSKLRFVFSQMTESGTPVDEFHVTGITLSGEIGKEEKLFTESTYSGHTYGTKLFDIGTAGYDVLSKTYPSDGARPTALGESPAPGDYMYQTGMTAQEYDDLISGGITSGALTQWGLTYLRETDKKLTGTITYTVGSGLSMQTKSASFTMEAEGDFTRNHSWTVYGYFIGGRLVVQPTVLPWIAGNDRFAFKTEGSTEFRYEKPWLRYDIDRMSWTWDDTWLVVAYGYEGGGSVGKPMYSPMLTMETINANDLTLQLNNDHFILVQMTESVDGEGNPVVSYSKHGQSITITGSSEKKVTNFYVVPVSDDVMADPYVKVFLTEMHSGDGLPPQNIPFNHNLPGDQDHTSLLIYNPGRAEYISNMNVHKDGSSNEQSTQYWLEEEG